MTAKRKKPSAADRKLAASLLSEAEERAVVLSALKGAPGKGVTESECAKALTWAKKARLHSVLLDLVLDGRINLLIRDGEVHWAGA